MEITAAQVKALRERTGAGMMECKTALTEAEGNAEEAVKVLRKKGLATAAKKSGRVTMEGQVGQYIHAGGKIGVLVEINCETDFVARTPEFHALVKDIAMHVAATNPRFVSREEVTPETLEQEKEIYRAQAAASGKPPEVVEKMVAGRMEKFYEESCLLEQPFVKDTNLTVGTLVTEKVAKLGENVKVRRFARFALGEGIEETS